MLSVQYLWLSYHFDCSVNTYSVWINLWLRSIAWQCAFVIITAMTFLFAEVAVGNNKLIGYLFTLGEVAQVCVCTAITFDNHKENIIHELLLVPHPQLCPAHTSSHVCYIVQSLLLASTECEG